MNSYDQSKINALIIITGAFGQTTLIGLLMFKWFKGNIKPVLYVVITKNYQLTIKCKFVTASFARM